MAIKGDVGKIMFENAGGTEADVGQTRSWSLSIRKDVLETEAQQKLLRGMLKVEFEKLRDEMKMDMESAKEDVAENE